MPSKKRQRKKQGRQARQEAMRAYQHRQARRRRIIAGLGLLVVIALVAAVFGTGGGEGENVSAGKGRAERAGTGETSRDDACPKADGSSPKKSEFDSAPPMCIDPAKRYTATIETDAGTIVAALDPAKAPKTVNNFVVLARYHYFDGLAFHRVIPGFVLQGGDPQGTGRGGPGYTFADELPEEGQYRTGSLAMANSGPNTNGSQFFIISGEQGEQLPPKYSLFGQVTDGLDVVERIEADGAPDPSPPKVVHKITKVTITES
ncbi:MAG: peptidylprolyl isomerase [Actinomycetota bacterium]|nr:peptidylprolyl isomerase [Actinomycetota bacterium]